MSSKKIFSIITFLFNFYFIDPVFSQENFEPCSIIKLSGDTLKGLIDYKYWSKTPVSISFKETENSQVTKYNPVTIKGFLVHNELYFSAIVEAEASPSVTNDLNFETQFKLRVDTTFLQALFLGTKNLYFFTDRNMKQHFYIGNQNNFELLVYKRFLKKNGDKREYSFSEPINIASENKKYLGQLLLYFQDCPSIKTEINSTQYLKQSFDELFTKYYENTKAELSYDHNKNKEKMKLNFGIVAGISITKLNFANRHGSVNPYILNVNYPSSINFSGGIFMDLLFARNPRNWSFYNELLINSFNTSNSFEEYQSEYDITQVTTNIGYSYLKLNSMMRYIHMLNNDFKLSLNTGLSIGVAFQETNTITKDRIYYGQQSNSMNPFIHSKSLETGFLLGSSLEYRNYVFDIRYETGNGMSKDNILHSRATRLYLLFGYTF